MENKTKIGMLKWAHMLSIRIKYLADKMSDGYILDLFRDCSGENRLIYLDDTYFSEDKVKLIDNYIKQQLDADDMEDYLYLKNEIEDNKRDIIEILTELSSFNSMEYQHDEAMFSDIKTVPGLLVKYYTKIDRIKGLIINLKEEINMIDTSDTIEDELFADWNPDEDA